MKLAGESGRVGDAVFIAQEAGGIADDIDEGEERASEGVDVAVDDR